MSSQKDLSERAVTRTKPTASGNTSRKHRPHAGAQGWGVGGLITDTGLPNVLQLQQSCFCPLSPKSVTDPLISERSNLCVPTVLRLCHSPLSPTAWSESPYQGLRGGGEEGEREQGSVSEEALSEAWRPERVENLSAQKPGEEGAGMVWGGAARRPGCAGALTLRSRWPRAASGSP